MNLNPSIAQKGLANYYLGKVKNPSASNLSYGAYLDSQAFYEIYPNAMNYEKLQEVSNEIDADDRMFIGEDRASMLEIWNTRFRRETTTKQSIKVYQPLKSTETNFRIVKVHCKKDVKKVGLGQSKWEMTINTRAANHKNWFTLKDHPHIRFAPTLQQGTPDGAGNMRFEFMIPQGQLKDFIYIEKLQDAEFEYSIAPLEEAAVQRGLLMPNNPYAKASVMYQYPGTRAGWEHQITDIFWLNAEYYQMVESDCDEGETPNRVTLSQIEMEFHNKCENVMDRYLTVGAGYSPLNGLPVDPYNRRNYQIGPSWFDFMLAMGAKTYSFDNFNILGEIDRFKRNIGKNKNASARDMVYHIITGTVGYNHVVKPELQRLDVFNNQDPKYAYKDVASMSGKQQGVMLAPKQIMGGYIDPYGCYEVHIADILDKGVLCGRHKFKGYPQSSAWIIIMAAKRDADDRDKMSNFILYELSAAERKDYVCGQLTPIGFTDKISNKGRFTQDGTLGDSYKVISDFWKFMYVSNMKENCVYFPDVKMEKKRRFAA